MGKLSCPRWSALAAPLLLTCSLLLGRSLDAQTTAGFPTLNAETATEGFALYRQHCASCHDHPSGQMPDRRTLGAMNRDMIYQALSVGPMKPMAAALDDRQKRLLAATLPQEPSLPEPDRNANLCKAPTGAPTLARGADWPAWSPDLSNTRFQPASGIKPADVPRLKLKWAFAYPGGVGGLPVVAKGRLYSASARGDVFALDARTGCTFWTAKVPSEVRGAPVVAAIDGKQAVIVADAEGHVTAFDAGNGGQLWSTAIFGDRIHRLSGSPVFYQDRLYVPVAAFEIPPSPDPAYECCKARGGLAVLDAKTGRKLWQADSIAEPLEKTHKSSVGTQNYGPAGASVWSAPTIDPKRGLVYIASGNGYTQPTPAGVDSVIAFDLATGARRWTSGTIAKDAWLAGCDRAPHPNCPNPVGPDSDVAMPPALATLAGGRQLLIAGSKGGMVYAFDPDAGGRMVWSTRVGTPSPVGSLVFGSAIFGGKAYFPISYSKPEGGLAALDLATGRIVWEAPPIMEGCAWGKDFCSAAQRSPPSAIPGVIFAGSNDAHIRAYAAGDGKVIWSFDGGRKVRAVNGVEAHGGSMGRGGQTIAEGMIFVNVGAGIGPSGNALLAFSVDGR